MSEEAAPAAASASPRYFRPVTALILAQYLLMALTPVISAGSPAANELLSIAVTLLFTALTVALVAQLAHWRLGAAGETVWALGALAVWPTLIHFAQAGDLLRLYLNPLVNLSFMFFCIMCGRLLSRILREPNILLPVCVVAMLADIVTVFLGPTGKALEVAPKLVEKFSVGLPQAGSAVGPQGAAGLAMLASMGIGDFVFLALFLTAAARFGFPLRRGGRVITVLLCLALVGFFALPLVHVNLPGIPLLPFIAGGFLIAYSRRFRLSRAEKQGMAWGALLLIVILGVAAWATHSGPPPPAPTAHGAQQAPAPNLRGAP